MKYLSLFVSLALSFTLQGCGVPEDGSGTEGAGGPASLRVPAVDETSMSVPDDEPKESGYSYYQYRTCYGRCWSCGGNVGGCPCQTKHSQKRYCELIAGRWVCGAWQDISKSCDCGTGAIQCYCKLTPLC